MRDSARPPFEDYRDHAAEIAHLPAGYRVLWMVSTTRIDNPFDTRMNCQIVYDAPGICTVAFHANVKRFCRPQEQEAVPRRRNRADCVLDLVKPARQIVVVDHHRQTIGKTALPNWPSGD